MDAEAPLRAGPLELRPRQRELLLDGVPQKLGARAFDLLEILMREADRPHPKRELLERVWPDVVVADNNLEVHVWALRKALGAGAILTVPGRGYRFALAAQPGAAPAPPLPIPPTSPTGLPARLPPLLGRADELLTLGTLVDTAPLVTVVGGGGVGKTLLVHHLLQARRGAFEHGVCWVDLSTLDEQAAVAPGIAAALGIGPAGARPGDAASGLADALAPLSLLLAIDNAEHRVDEVMQLATQVLAAAPQVHIVVTSQTPLQARGERVFRLGPLAVPDAPIQPDEIPAWGALALFEARVRALDRHFTWTAATVELARTVCLRLDGAPLAIELAAARVPLLGLAALATALDEPLAVLTRGPGDAPARQRSLRAALEWSHALLNADERIVFRRLAAFSGAPGLGLLVDALGADGAEAGAEPALDRVRLLDALNGLVERSLVATSGGEGEPRLRLLEAPRALARERLAAAGEVQLLERRHARAVVRHLCRWHERFLEGAIGHDTLMQALEADLDNARAALRWALAHDAAVAVALARPMSMVLTGARRTECDTVWAATERCVSPQQDAALRAGWLLGSAGFRADSEARLSEQHASAAALLYRALGDEQGEARALAYVASSRLDDAAERQRAAFERMQSLVKPDWPPATLAAVCRAECLYAYRREDFDTVEAAFRRWLAHSDGVGNAVASNAVAMNLADLALARGRAAEAVQLSQAPLARLRGSRDRYAFSILCMNLSAALLACDRIAEARAIITEAWPLAPALSMQSRWLDYLALLAALEGRCADAAALLTRADADFRAKGERRERHQQRSCERAAALVAAAGLDAAALERARAAGRCLTDREAGALGLAPSTP